MAAMDGIITDIKSFSVHDGPGIRTTIFLKGCEMHCQWCHNPEGISPVPECAYVAHKCIHCGECLRVCPSGAQAIDAQGKHVFLKQKCIACGACEDVCLGNAMKLYGRKISAQEVLETVLKDKAFYETTKGGVTLSGGEPLLQPDFCTGFMGLLRDHGIHTAVDTAGYVNWRAFALSAPVTDLYLYDLKHMDSQFHKQLTGHGNELILYNLQRLSDTAADIEVRFVCIPSVNMDRANIESMSCYLASLKNIPRVRLLAYHLFADSKYESLGYRMQLQGICPPQKEEIQRVAMQLREHGIAVTIA